MKDNLCKILLCGFILLSITACNDVSNIRTMQKDYVSITIKDDTLTNKGATFILENIGDDTLGYGDDYELEIMKNENWTKMNGELAFNEPLWELKPKEIKEIEIEWENTYGKLSAGKYRLLKKIYIKATDDNTGLNDFYIQYEFTIE